MGRDMDRWMDRRNGVRWIGVMWDGWEGKGWGRVE